MKESHLFSNKLELTFLAFTINLLVFRIAFPFLEYLFVPAALLLIVYSLYLLWIEKHSSLIAKSYISTFYLFILIGLAYLIPLTYTSTYSVLIIREALTFLFFLFLILVFMFLIKTEEQYKKFQKEYFNQVLIISVIAATLGISKFFLHLYGYDLPFLEKNGYYPVGTSLKLDHNFSSITSFFGILLILIRLRKLLFKKRRILYQLLCFYSPLISISLFREGVSFY